MLHAISYLKYCIEYEGHDCLRAVNFMRDEAHLEVLRKSKRKMKNKIQIG